MQKNLDFLRAIAVLLVLGAHLALYNHPHIAFSIAAHIGVLLFFVHTSYVLMLSLDRLAEHHKNFSRTAITFYIRRAFRIYPLAMISITIVTLLGDPYLLPRAQETAGTYLSNLFLVQNLTLRPETFGGLWTLPVELQTYLLLPFCFVLAKRSIKLATLLGVLSVSVGVLASTSHSDIFSSALYFPCFASGILAYALTLHYGNLRKISGAYWAITLLAVVTATGLIFRPEGVSNIVSDWITSLSIALLIPLFKDMSTSWLSKASFQIAKYSYGIYLFHLPIMTFTRNGWLGTIILTGLASVVAYYLIESPLITLGKKLTTKESSRTDTLLDVAVP